MIAFTRHDSLAKVVSSIHKSLESFRRLSKEGSKRGKCPESVLVKEATLLGHLC
jgi:hypothetical protein